MKNMHDLFQVVRKRWYYFLIAGVIFSIFGGIYYLTTPKSFNTSMLYHFREDEQGRMFYTHENAMERAILTRGYDVRVTDEQERMNSHELMREVILDNGLQVELRQKKRLKYEGIWPNNIVAAELRNQTPATLSENVTLKIKKSANGYSIKAKVRKEHQSYQLASLEQPIDLPIVGGLQLTDNGLEEGVSYKLILEPLNAAADNFCGSIKSDRCGEDNHIMEIFSTSDMPGRTEFIMNRMVEAYNRLTIEERRMLAQQATDFLAQRIDSTAEEMAAIKKDASIPAEKREMLLLSKKDNMQQLMARQNDLAFAQIYSLDPIQVLDAPHTAVKPAGPRASIIALIILLLTLCCPMVVVYLEEVIKGE